MATVIEKQSLIGKRVPKPDGPDKAVGRTRYVNDMELPRMLIGRSEHNDLSIDSRFVSRHHMLLVRHGSSTFLMDLNSTNGTYVNSRRVSNHVLIDNDIITVGHHRIKFCDPHAKQRGTLDGESSLIRQS